MISLNFISDTEFKQSLVNGFALTSKLGVGAGWASLMLLTSESFPTVVRYVKGHFSCNCQNAF